MRDMSLLNKDGLNEQEFLSSYKPRNYERPSNTVDMLLFTVDDESVQANNESKVLKVLLVKRGNHPYMGCFAIPGGFVNIDEGLSSACYRELKEETNVENVYFEQLKTFGDNVKRDPRMRVISTVYMALADKTDIKPVAGDDADEAKWFTVKKNFVSSDQTGKDKISTYNIILTSDDGKIKIGYTVIEKTIKKGVVPISESSYEPLDWSKNELAFDHIEIIDYALETLKNKLEYTPIAFNLMPKYFTLVELQRVYEAILNLPKGLLTSGFQRKIEKMIFKVNGEKNGKSEAECYMFNENWQRSFLAEE